MKHTWVPEHSTTRAERPFRELRPILPDAGSRYVPREAPAIPMFAAEIRTQQRSQRPTFKADRFDVERAHDRQVARRRRDARINREAVVAIRRLRAQPEGNAE